MIEAKKFLLGEKSTDKRRQRVLEAATLIATLISLGWVYKELRKDSSDTEAPQLDQAQRDIEEQQRMALEGLSQEEKDEALRMADERIRTHATSTAEGGQNE